VLQGKGVIDMFHYWDVGLHQRVYVVHRPGCEVEAHAGLELHEHGHWIRERSYE